MFSNNDNPQLFKVLKEKVEILTQNKIDREYLTDEELELIEELEIKISADVKSLYGIEKCVNLKAFKQVGLSPYATIAHEVDDQFYVRDFLCNQVIDLRPLYKCEKLESINLNHQRKLPFINLSTWKNLRELSLIGCEELKDVFGLDSVIANNDKKSKVILNFGDCFSLNKILMFNDALKLIDDKKYSSEELQLILPSFSYLRFSKQKNFKDMKFLLSKIESNEKCKEVILWSENQYRNLETVYHLSSQMNIANKYLDEILDNIFEKSTPSSRLEKIIYVYQWISKNINYDLENCQKTNEIQFSNRKYMPLDASIRSSFVALWKKEVVCVGYANLLVSFLTKLGVDAFPVSCKYNCPYQMKKGGGNHAIVKIGTLKGNYYCDPTTKHIDYFMLNDKELKEKEIFVSLAYQTVLTAPSIRNEINEYIKNGNSAEDFRGKSIKSLRKIRKIINRVFGDEYSKLTTQEKEMATEMVKNMEEVRLIVK